MDEIYNGVRTGSLDCNQVSKKLPQYFDVADMWFRQVEAVFKLSKISSETTKFLYVTASLPPSILMEFQEYFNTESATPYTDLQQAIIRSRWQPSSVHFDALFSAYGMSDRRTSGHLKILQRHRAQLGPTSEDDQILRNAFLRALPIDIQKHLHMKGTKIYHT